jgi:hypothetical protein
MIKFGGDLDDPDNAADPFGMRGEVEAVLYEQVAEQLRAQGTCATAYTDAIGERQMCLRDWALCELHNPAVRDREAKFVDRYVGLLTRWWRR